MSEPAIDVEGLHKRYGDLTAVDGLDLRIRPGEVVGILGPNGAGKSTTVEILQGHRSRDGGTVRVLGADPATADRRWRSRIESVRQDESAPAELTVKETVEHFARYYPKPRAPGTSSPWSAWTRRPGHGSRNCPAAGGAGWTWRRVWSAPPISCSWTNRRRVPVLFTFTFPMVFLTLFASIFSDGVEGCARGSSRCSCPTPRP